MRKWFYFSPFSALTPTWKVHMKSTIWRVPYEESLPCWVTDPLNTCGDDFLTLFLDIKNMSISFTLQSFSLSLGPVKFVTQGAWREHGVWWLLWDAILCSSFSCHSVVLHGKGGGIREKSKWLSWAPLQSAISLCCFSERCWMPSVWWSLNTGFHKGQWDVYHLTSWSLSNPISFSTLFNHQPPTANRLTPQGGGTCNLA